MQRLWPIEMGIARIIRNHLRGASAESPHPTGMLARYAIDGLPSRVPEGVSIAAATEFARESPDRMVMLFYPKPSATEIRELAEAWQLHPVLVEDLVGAQQRPKLERYGDTLFLVARSARYIDETEEVEFAEFHVLLRPGAVAVLCQDEHWIDGTDGDRFDEQDADFDAREHTMLADQHLLSLGPEAVVYLLLDAIVHRYKPVLRGISIDKEQIERQVFGGDVTVAERIYRLTQEVVDMQQAISSLTEAVRELQERFAAQEVSQELRTRLDDVADRLLQAGTATAGLRESLGQILNVNATLVNQRQNEDMKRISGWAAILFAPSLIGGIYGMNFDGMPELHWAFGYPFALGLMLALAAVLYVVFKRSKWI